MDERSTVAELRQIVKAFQTARNWQRFHSPKSLAMSIAIEAAELMEHFQWLTIQESINTLQDEAKRQAVAMELADVVIYCLGFANECDIDISEAIDTKMGLNALRYPALLAQDRSAPQAGS